VETVEDSAEIERIESRFHDQLKAAAGKYRGSIRRNVNSTKELGSDSHFSSGNCYYCCIYLVVGLN
jgi:hypothetical protein